VFDARNAHWSFQTFPTSKQNYPISIMGGAANALGRRRSKAPTAHGLGRCTAWPTGRAFNFGNGRSTEGFILDGIRIHNV
jgi:hypothetical protein